MNDWTEQHRPAPQFEREVPTTPPEERQLPDLEAMARRLDDMKVEAHIDAERTRPGLNGFFTFVVVTGATYIGAFVRQDGMGAFTKLTHTRPSDDPATVAVALGVGLAAAIAAGVASHLATRRTRREVQAFEERLIGLGGTPLPARGLALETKRRRAAR